MATQKKSFPPPLNVDNFFFDFFLIFFAVIRAYIKKGNKILQRYFPSFLLLFPFSSCFPFSSFLHFFPLFSFSPKSKYFPVFSFFCKSFRPGGREGVARIYIPAFHNILLHLVYYLWANGDRIFLSQILWWPSLIAWQHLCML